MRSREQQCDISNDWYSLLPWHVPVNVNSGFTHLASTKWISVTNGVVGTYLMNVQCLPFAVHAVHWLQSTCQWSNVEYYSYTAGGVFLSVSRTVSWRVCLMISCSRGSGLSKIIIIAERKWGRLKSRVKTKWKPCWRVSYLCILNIDWVLNGQSAYPHLSVMPLMSTCDITQIKLVSSTSDSI